MNTDQGIISKLQKIGFSEKEAKVYLSCLSLGTANMTDIARVAVLKRSNTYFIVEALIQRGYLTKIQKGKIDYYKAIEPERVVFEQVERTRIAESLLPQLQTISVNSARSHVTFFEGRNQLEEAYDALFRSKELWSIVYLDEYWKLFDENHNRHLYELLKRHGGINHILIPNTKKNIECASRKYRNGLQEVRLLPSSFDTSKKTGITFNDRMVMFTSYLSISSTCIGDEEIIGTMRQLFQTLWNQSSPLTEEDRGRSEEGLIQ